MCVCVCVYHKKEEIGLENLKRMLKLFYFLCNVSLFKFIIREHVAISSSQVMLII